MALKTQTLEGEKKALPNGSSFLINPLNKEEEHIDSLRFRNNRGGYNSGFKGGSLHQRGSVRG